MKIRDMGPQDLVKVWESYMRHEMDSLNMLNYVRSDASQELKDGYQAGILFAINMLASFNPFREEI